MTTPHAFLSNCLVRLAAQGEVTIRTRPAPELEPPAVAEPLQRGDDVQVDVSPEVARQRQHPGRRGPVRAVEARVVGVVVIPARRSSSARRAGSSEGSGVWQGTSESY